MPGSNSRSKSVNKMDTKKKSNTKTVVMSKPKKDEDELTRPRSGYNFFTIEVAEELAGQKMERGGLLREVGKRWQKMKPKDKAKYEEMADEERKRFEGKMSKDKGSKRAQSTKNTKRGRVIIDEEDE